MYAVLSFIACETCEASVKVLKDNQGTKTLIENPLSSARSKHFDVHFQCMRLATAARPRMAVPEETNLPTLVTTDTTVA